MGQRSSIAFLAAGLVFAAALVSRVARADEWATVPTSCGDRVCPQVAALGRGERVRYALSPASTLRISISGRSRMGWAFAGSRSGGASECTTIAWFDEQEGVRELRTPVEIDPAAVVFECLVDRCRIRAALPRPSTDALAWQRFEERATEYLLRVGSPRPTALSRDTEIWLRAVDASRAFPKGESLRPLLHTLLAELVINAEPNASPRVGTFTRHVVRHSMHAGQPLELSFAKRARVRLEAVLSPGAELDVYRDSALVARMKNGSSRSQQRSVLVPIAATGRVRIDVTRGEARIGVSSHTFRPQISHVSPVEASPRPEGALAAYVAAWTTGSATLLVDVTREYLAQVALGGFASVAGPLLDLLASRLFDLDVELDPRSCALLGAYASSDGSEAHAALVALVARRCARAEAEFPWPFAQNAPAQARTLFSRRTLWMDSVGPDALTTEIREGATERAGTECSLGSEDWWNPPRGTYEIVTRRGTLRALARPEIDAAFDLDTVALAVHGLTFRESRAPLEAGAHVIETPGDIFFRLPLVDEIPCTQVVALERWRHVQDETRFSAPARRRVVATRIMFRDLDGTAQVQVGGIEATVESSCREASIELGVRGDAPVVRVRADGLARVRYRAFFENESADVDDPIHAPSLDRAAAVALLAQASMDALDPATPEGIRRTAQLTRARALEALGYSRQLVSPDLVSLNDLATPNLVARIGALSTSASHIDAIRTAVRSGGERGAYDVMRARFASAQGSAGQSLDSALAFALALMARDRGDDELAAAAFDQLTDVDARLERAVLMGERASRAQDSALAAAAFAALRECAALGVDTTRVERRLSNAATWVMPAALDNAGGTRVVAARHDDDFDDRVRRAFLAAPADSVLLSEGESVLINPGTSAASASSALRDDVVQLRVIGRAVPFRRNVATCELTATVGTSEHRITPDNATLLSTARPVAVATTPGCIAWIEFGSHRFSIERRWFVATADSPAALRVLGPTVVRVTVRDRAKLAARVEGELVPSVPLDADRTLDIPVPDRGPALVEVAPLDRESADVRLSVVRFDRAPPNIERSPPVEVAVDTPNNVRASPPIPSATSTGPFTLRASVAFVNRSIADLDAVAQGSPYGEVDVGIARTAFAPAWTFGARGFARFREGPSSYGGRLDVERDPDGWFPRLTFSGEVATQSQIRADVLTWSVRGSAIFRVPILTESTIGALDLFPWIAARYRNTGELPPEAVFLDPTVYSDYLALRPFAASLGATLLSRPWSDVVLRCGSSLVFNPNLQSVDRWDGFARIDAALFDGWFPAFALQYTVSGRFATFLRFEGFVRHTFTVEATAWRWALDSYLFTLGAALNFVPQPLVFDGQVRLSIFWSDHRGVADLGAREIEFSERREEGSGRLVGARGTRVSDPVLE